jgi:aryl-phospho-beta-D-glucosidase BglC (GH1 family)
MSIAAMDMVFVAYETILERYPDQDGFAFWVDSISNTNPTTPEAWYEESTHLLNQFLESDEYVNNNGVLSDSEFVTDAYEITLMRNPDASGQQFWLSNLEAGILDRADVMLGFITSEEFTQKFMPSTTDQLISSEFLTTSQAWSTAGNQILDPSGNSAQLQSVSWFGFEGSDGVIDGLWERSYKDMLDQILDEGFNTIRLPFAGESLTFTPNTTDPNAANYTYIGGPGDPIYTDNVDFLGKTTLQMMDLVVDYADQIGLDVVLDHHRMSLGVGTENGLWYNDTYSAADWVNGWKQLATRYAGYDNVIGADIQNEPYNGTWGGGGATDWALAAETAGNAILQVNPNWLIFVEGVANYNNNGTSTSYWWGGNLIGVADRPIVLDLSNKVVYSPHDYPSSVSSQPWFSDPSYPDNLPAIWDEYWGYIYRDEMAPIWIGEFGTKLQTDSDAQWLEHLTAYLGGDFNDDGVRDIPASDEGMSWAYFGWGPNSGDTGGILQDDWISVWQDKLDDLEAAYT